MTFGFSNKLSQTKYHVYFILFAIVICYLFALQFEAFEGGADNYIHYRNSRYAFQYPMLFLDHWGKPVFTLLSAPFAQLGFKGMLLFNIICGVLTCYFTFKVAQQLKLNYAWVAAILTITAPIYFLLMASAMTETLFSLLLIIAVYFLLKKKYVLSAVLFSLLFLVRTEGYIFYPFIALIFVVKKQWQYIPFLATGFLVYSTIGLFVYGDFLWLINQNPYHDTSSIYGKGELLHYVKQNKNIFGNFSTVLLVFGLLIASVNSGKLLFKKRELNTDFLLIEGLFLMYLVAHSYVWWTGTGASLGLIRVMAGVVPLMAITSVRTLDFLSSVIRLPPKYFETFVYVISAYLLFIPFKTYSIPFKYGEREKTISGAVTWFKSSTHKEQKVYFFEPLVFFLLDRNPFDHSVIKERIDDLEHPENSVKVGEIIFYDMHFGPNEGALPLERLMNNSKFKLINTFKPAHNFQVLGGYDYAMLLFERVEQNNKDNYRLLQSQEDEKFVFTPFENLIAKDTNSISGEEFTLLLEKKHEEIKELFAEKYIRVTVNYLFEPSDKPLEAYLVISVEKDGKAIIYNAVPLVFSEIEATLKNDIQVSPNLKGDETIKVYIWNRTNHKGTVTKADVFRGDKKY